MVRNAFAIRRNYATEYSSADADNGVTRTAGLSKLKKICAAAAYFDNARF